MSSLNVFASQIRSQVQEKILITKTKTLLIADDSSTALKFITIALKNLPKRWIYRNQNTPTSEGCWSGKRCGIERKMADIWLILLTFLAEPNLEHLFFLPVYCTQWHCICIQSGHRQWQLAEQAPPICIYVRPILLLHHHKQTKNLHVCSALKKLVTKLVTTISHKVRVVFTRTFPNRKAVKS